MFKWILAAIGIAALSMVISVVSRNLLHTAPPSSYDPAAIELSSQIQQQYTQVPLVALLANPERYDGKKVLISGFVTLDFESSGVHFDRAAYEAGLRKNALWLDPPAWLTEGKTKNLNRHYGSVAGTFLASEMGHVNAYSGTITEVKRIEKILTVTEYDQGVRLRDGSRAIVQQLLSGWFLTMIGWMGLWLFWAVRTR